MTEPTPQTTASPWARLGAELPEDLGKRRVLVVGLAGESGELALEGAAEVVHWDPTGTAPRPDGLFDLFVSAGALQADPHPANLLTAFCNVAAPGATLLLHSRVLTDPEQSMYARFVGADAGVGGTEWLPGRLALRWSVETNGFDIVRWIDAGPADPRGEADAFLLATRNERTPALILATPATVDGPSQKGGKA
jgi:hypothetical protein